MKIQTNYFGDLPLQSISRDLVPLDLLHVDEYTTFYKVTRGPRTWYLAKGHRHAPKQVVVWYPNGKFWSSYGSTLTEAFNKACEDAARYI